MNKKHSQKIDTNARREYLTLLRQLLRGKLTNRGYERLAEAKGGPLDRDNACDAIHHELAWCWYCDFRTQRIHWREFPAPARAYAARALLLLRTGEPMVERPAPGVLWYMKAASILGTVGSTIWLVATKPVVGGLVAVLTMIAAWVRIPRSTGHDESECFPFADVDALRRAVESPHLLTGTAGN